MEGESFPEAENIAIVELGESSDSIVETDEEAGTDFDLEEVADYDSETSIESSPEISIDSGLESSIESDPETTIDSDLETPIDSALESVPESSDDGNLEFGTATYPTGLNLSGIATDIIYGEAIDDASFQDTYPSYYINPNLPPLRNQNPYGTCWSFATIALTEINLIKNGSLSNPDLSELHLAYFGWNSVVDPLGGTEGDFISYGKKVLNNGGNFEKGFDTLQKWTGAASESDVPYSLSSQVQGKGLDDALAYKDIVHIESAYYTKVDLDSLRNNRDISALTPVKKMISEYGAAGMYFGALTSLGNTASDEIFSNRYKSYYNSNHKNINHAVVIVGWDDDFPKEHFPTTAPGDGAFLIRNSWSTNGSPSDLDYTGYFWMSYYESSLYDLFYAIEATTADNYDNNYQYDGYNVGMCLTVDQGANVFTAHAEDADKGELLRAVTFYSIAQSTSYRIDIYTDVKDTPSSGNLVPTATTTGTTEFAGYTNVVLNSPVYLAPGTKFAVSVTLGTPGLMADMSETSDFPFGAVSRDGESFYGYSSYWYPLSDSFRIKAYTDNAVEIPGSEEEINKEEEKEEGKEEPTEPEIIPEDVNELPADWGDITDSFIMERFDNDPANVPAKNWYVVGEDVVLDTDSPHLDYSVDYTGSKITFDSDISVYNGTTRLSPGRDYTISYSDNIAAGSHSNFTIKIKGASKSTRTFYFVINKVPMSKAVVTSEIVVPVSKGSKKLKSVKVKLSYGSKTLKAGTDYRLEYEGPDGFIDDPSRITLNNLGDSYNISIFATEKSNFEGPHNQTISVVVVDPKEVISAAKFTVGDANRKALKFNYCDIADGITPADLFTDGRAYVYYNKKVLTPGVDYDVLEVDENYSGVGTHRLRIVGLDGSDSFIGSKTVTFKVLPYNIKNDTGNRLNIDVSDANYSKTGATPDITISFTGPDGETTELVQGVDYTLTYKNNKKAADKGSAKAPTVVIKGKGRFTGTISRKFTITSA